MSWHFGARARKSLADVTRRKARTLLVVLGIFIGVFGLTAINVTGDTLVNAFAFTVGAQALRPDYQLTVDRLDPALVPAVLAVPNVRAAQAVSSYSACWRPIPTGCAVTIDLVSAPDLRHLAITPFQLTAGRYPETGEVVMEQGDRGLGAFTLGSLVTLHAEDRAKGDRTIRLRVVGLARTPGANPAVSGDASAYLSDAGLAQVAAALGDGARTGPDGHSVSPYQHHIQVKFQNPDATLAGQTATALQRVLAAHGVAVLDAGFAPKADPTVLGTIEGIFGLLRTFALLAVGLSTLLILNTITTLVTEQTAIIGAMKALGGTRGAIIRGYLVTVFVYSLVATLPALALGLYAGYLLASMLAPQIPLEVGPFAVAPWVVAVSLAVGLGVPALAALPPLWNGTRVTVRQALAAYGVSAGAPRGAMARLGARLTWVSQTTWLGLRGFLRQRWRAALSLTTLGLAAACFLVAQVAATSVNDTIGAVRAPIAADMTVYFKDPSAYGRLRDQLLALPNVADIERSGGTNATTAWGTLQVSGYEPDTHLYHYQLTGGRWFRAGDTDVVLLSDDALRKTGLHIGDILTLTNNYGSSTRLTLTIIGTVHQTIDVLGWIGAAVLPVNTLYELRGVPADQATGAALEITIAARNRSPRAVDRLAAAVSAVVNPAGASSDDPGYYDGAGGTIDTMREYTTRRQGDAVVLYYLLDALAIIVGMVGALGLANALVASVLERRREIGLLRALGASGRRVARVFLVESLALGTLAWCAGALIGLPLAYAFVRTFAWQVMPVDFSVDPGAFAVMLAATLAIATLASAAPAWRAARLRVAETLRYE